jgi:hypothetical protein
VLSGGEQSFDDFAVQVVGDHDAHRIDVLRLGDRMPVVFGALIAVPLGGVVGDGGVGVGNRDQPHVGVVGAEQGGGGAVASGVSATGHATADHGHADGCGSASHVQNSFEVS